VDVISLHVTEPDEAREVCGRVYYPHRLSILHEPARFAMSLSALNLGPVSVGLLRYAGEVCLETAELETGYEINVPLSGRLLTSSGPAEVYATPRTAALYRPDARTRLQGWADGGTLFGLKVERSVLEARLARRVGLSTRALQYGFAAQAGLSPMAYLRQVRLQRAHADLRAGGGAGPSVAGVANRSPTATSRSTSPAISSAGWNPSTSPGELSEDPDSRGCRHARADGLLRSPGRPRGV
jgi:AraC-like DNA-binding protein